MTILCHICIGCFIYIVFCYATAEGTSPSAVPVRSASEEQLRPGRSSLYSEWSPWTSCSATCGLGIISRSRTCLKSAYNAKGVYVPLCHAEYDEHKICNLRECPSDVPNARAVLCSQHNNRTVAGTLVKEWTPTNEGPNPCELRCKASGAEGVGLEYGFGKVSDGTPCTRGVCLDGRCLSVGCDERLGSEVTAVDMCGVCGGRNASCVHYKDVFMGQPPSDSERRNGYREVVVLPVGARNLVVRQLVGKNYLALQDRSRGIIFNGEHHLTQYGGRFDIAGTTVQFDKSTDSESTEVLTARGPVTEELYVLVLLRSFNQGIYYEYWLPKQSHNPSREQHSMRRQAMTSDSVPFATTAANAKVGDERYARSRPTKPAFAYGYGEKPYKSQDAPVFRHRITTTSAPVSTKNPHHVHPSVSHYGYGYDKKNVNRLYMPRLDGPSGGYYQTYRNASAVSSSRKFQDWGLERELPSLTQPDHGNTILDEKKVPDPKPLKSPLDKAFEISKRGGGSSKFVDQDSRLKYSLQDADRVYVETGPAPLSFALLPSQGSSKGRKKKGGCAPCERSRDSTQHFCSSDFVIRGLVIGYEFLHGETRYELEVRQTFKNTLSLLSKEYVWSPDTCRCPKLRPGKEYVIMGRTDNNYRKRESRLLVDKTCFVRAFNLKYARRLQKLRKDYSKKCTKS